MEPVYLFLYASPLLDIFLQKLINSSSISGDFVLIYKVHLLCLLIEYQKFLINMKNCFQNYLITINIVRHAKRMRE